MTSAKVAMDMELYDEMVAEMKGVIETGVELSDEERNLFSVAYKNVHDARRSKLRNVPSIIEGREDAVRKYKKKVETELRDICNKVLAQLEQLLIANASTAESKVFYLNMRGEYFRYLADVATGDSKTELLDNSQKAYQDAHVILKNAESANKRLQAEFSTLNKKNEILFQEKEDLTSQLATHKERANNFVINKRRSERKKMKNLREK